MEQAPESLQKTLKRKRGGKKFGDLHVTLTCILLALSQVFKLVFFSLLLACLFGDLDKDHQNILFITNLFEIDSMFTLLGASVSEIYYWFRLYRAVESQAQQLSQ